MAEITMARTGALLRTLFEILMENPDGVRAGDAIAMLQKRVTLTPYEKGSYESGGTRFNKIVRFATVDCVKAGWLLKQKGIWTVTEKGKEAYRTYSQPESFYRQAVKLYREWKASQLLSPQTKGLVNETATPDEVEEKEVGVTYEQAEEQAWKEVEHYLKHMNPYDFQALVAALLDAMGYHVSWISPPGKDGGLDILAYSDPLGTRPPRIKVQVKRVEAPIAVGDLRAFIALLGDDDVGLFVTTSSFTKDAQNEARTQERRKLTLIDLERLFDLWVEYYARLSDVARRRLPLQPIYFLAPET